jgi:hypothetical protein
METLGLGAEGGYGWVGVEYRHGIVGWVGCTVYSDSWTRDGVEVGCWRV